MALRLVLLLLVFVTSSHAQPQTSQTGCEVNNPNIQKITISDAKEQFQDVKEKLELLAGKLKAKEYPQDCDGLPRGPSGSPSGVYYIRPADCVEPFLVYCDMDTDGGGWTTIQRREDGSVSFNRGWSDYQRGFGSRMSEYWIGNENLFWLTAQKSYQLLIDLVDFNGDSRMATYNSFRLGDRATRYQLQIGDYDSTHSTAGDALSYHNRLPFTTPDYDNDKATTGNCAKHFRSGWWFKSCYHANLNGVYRINGEEQDTKGIVWTEWRGLNISLKLTEMKIRPGPSTIIQ